MLNTGKAASWTSVEVVQYLTSELTQAEKNVFAGAFAQLSSFENQYDRAAQNGHLHNMDVSSAVIFPLSKGVMEHLYDYRLVRSIVGKELYALLKLGATYCLLCGTNTVFEIEHFLPKAIYWIYSVTPLNLLPCCKHCNSLKGQFPPTDPNYRFIHPYFDELNSDFVWLRGKVIYVDGDPEIEFAIQRAPEWDDDLAQRVNNHFVRLNLGGVYNRESRRIVNSIRFNMTNLLKSVGENGVRDHLLSMKDSTAAGLALNHWLTATYDALANDDDYRKVYLHLF